MHPGLVFVVMSLGAAITASIAAEKNRSIAGWAVIGALMPLIAAVIIGSQPALPKPSAKAGG
jgi:ribose/xylose/arabinose/galactoside ABC-type transport system permease subunit